MSRKSKIRRLVFGGTVFLISAAAAAYGVLSGEGVQAEMSEARRESVEDYYTEEGVISFGGEYQVTVEVTGPVKELCVEENSRVEKGDVLFRVDSTDYEYEKALAESALDGYEAQLELSRISQVMTTSPQEYLSGIRQELAASEASYQAARSVYEADRLLYDTGTVSRVQMESDAAAYETALAGWQQAKARYEESSRYLKQLEEEGIDPSAINSRFYESERVRIAAQIEAQKTAIQKLEDQIARCEVKTERAGLVSSLPVKGMSIIHTGETAAILRSLDKKEVEADVLTNIAPYIKAGDPVEVTLSLRGKDEVYQGCVSEVYDYAEKGTSALGLSEYRVHVRAELTDSEGLDGREGYGVHVKFRLFSGEDCLTVPADAVFEYDGQEYVYLAVDKTAVKTPVEIAYQTGTVAVIASGIPEGAAVVGRVDSEEIYDGVKIRD